LLSKEKIDYEKLAEINHNPYFSFDTNTFAYIALLSGRMDVFQALSEQLSSEAKKFILSSTEVLTSLAAARIEINWPSILEHPIDATFKTKDYLIAADYRILFHDACIYGSSALVAHLGQILGEDGTKGVIRACKYDAYRSACKSGNLELVTQLGQILGPVETEAAICAGDYATYRSACAEGNISLTKHLLTHENCFAYAESHGQEYGKKYIYSFVDLQLRLLQHRKDTFQVETPEGVFNLPDHEARYYFYLLRNLIRRGVTRDYAQAENLHDALIALLEIPSVKALCHQRIDETGQENELLRFAMSIGNTQAVESLLNIPAVRELAEANNFYQTERRGGIDFQELARNRESSMTALTEGEQQRLSELQTYYQETIITTGVNNIFYDLLCQLESRYEKNPAFITRDNGQEIKLPLKWDDFEALQLSEPEKDRALKAYYQDNNHTAIRYLSKPNKWMAPNASHVEENSAGERWSTFQEYKPLIALLYLGAQDEQIDSMDGYTHQARLENFIKELALIGRAHNWDKTRLNSVTKCEEEYDDLEGDKPSCYSGVKRRLFQSLLGHPKYTVLTKETVQQELRDFVRTYWQKILTETNKPLIDASYTKYVIGEAIDHNDWNNLRLMDVPDAQQKAFMDSMSKKYGGQFSLHLSFRKAIELRFKYIRNPDAHILNLADFQPEQFFSNTTQESSPGRNALFASRNSASFFSDESTENSSSEIPPDAGPNSLPS